MLMKITGNCYSAQQLSFKSNIEEKHKNQIRTEMNNTNEQDDADRKKLELILDIIGITNKARILNAHDEIMRGNDEDAKDLFANVIGNQKRALIAYNEKRYENCLPSGVKVSASLKRMKNDEYHKDWALFEFPDGEKHLIKYKYSPEKKESLEQIALIINQGSEGINFSKLEFIYFDDFSLKDTKETEISESEAQDLFECIKEEDLYDQFQKEFIFI